MIFVSSSARCTVFGVLSVLGVVALLTHSAYAQSPPADTSPTLSEGFSFRLGPYRDEAITQTINALKKNDEFQRARDLESANKDIFSQTIDLLRFVPFKLGDSNGNIDDFFTPNYLRPDYAAPPNAHLFDVK